MKISEKTVSTHTSNPFNTKAENRRGSEKTVMRQRGRPLRQTMAHRIEQGLMLVTHLVLLIWILYILFQGGKNDVLTVLLHFSGIAIYGTLLIALCAYLAKRRYLNELLEKNS